MLARRRKPSAHGLFFLVFCSLGAPALFVGSTGCSGEAHAGPPAQPEDAATKAPVSARQPAAQPTKPKTNKARYWREGDGSPVAGSGYDPKLSLAPMIEVVAPAVVSVTGSGSGPFGQGGGIGSGFIISPDGLVVTNHHVVAGREQLEVHFDDGRRFQAELVGSDPQTDIAVIRLDGAKGLRTVVLGSSDKLKVGDWVVAVGSPMGLEQTATRGILSAKGRGSLGLYRDGYADFLQTDAAINPGNSGGPLFNLAGEVVGINTAVGGHDGLGFAVPIDQAKVVLPKLIQSGAVQRGWLGVSGRDAAPDYGAKPISGAVIADVGADTPAATAGLREGDRVIDVDGHGIDSFNDLRGRIGEYAPREKVQLGLVRDGQRKTIEVTLGERPTPDALRRIGGATPGPMNPFPQMPAPKAEPPASPKAPPAAGPAGSDLYGGKPARLGIEVQPEGEGLAVKRVVDGGVGHRLGLRAGDVLRSVNGKRVRSVPEILSALEGERSQVTIEFNRGQGSFRSAISSR